MKTPLLLPFLIVSLLVLPSTLPAVRAKEPTIAVSPTEGPPGTLISVSGQGFQPGANVQLLWYTMEGNRVSGSGFTQVNQSIGTGLADSAGSFSTSFQAPYDLGGPPHRIGAVLGSQAVANTTFTLTRRAWITPTSGPEGTAITFNMIGGGWTQYDNNIGITYDNAFLGFACSFNSEGNITVYLQASGGVGPHVIGIYPALYYGPSDGPTPWKHPTLSVNDLPVKYEPIRLIFDITEGAGGTHSYIGGKELRTVTTPDSLLIPSLPAEIADAVQPHLSLGNAAKGTAGGKLPYTLTGFSPGAHVQLRWNTVTGTTSIGGVLMDKFLGWTFTPKVFILHEDNVSDQGFSAGTLSIPYDFGGDHLIEAVIDGQVQTSAVLQIIPSFSASLNSTGSEVLIRGTGLGWEKYTAIWDILYDNKLMGWVSGLTSNGNVSISLPAIGTPGLHTIDIHEGSNGWPYLNMHESPWPWEPVYRFAFIIQEPAPQNDLASMLMWVAPPLLGVGIVGVFFANRLRRRL